jgi:hypothetical protein
MKATVVNITLPKLVQVSDYHELSEIARHINIMRPVNVDKVNAAEIGFNGLYVGVIYSGEKPDEETIKELALQQGIGYHSKR